MSDLLNVPDVGDLALAAIEPPSHGHFRDDPKAWLKSNLFGSVVSTVFTVVFAVLFAYIFYRTAVYVFVTARWEVVEAGLTSLMVGLNPRDNASLLRPWITLALLVAVGGFVTGIGKRRTGQTWRIAARPWAVPLLVGLLVLGLTQTATPKLLGLGVLIVLVNTALVGSVLPERAARKMWIPYVIMVIAAAFVLTGGEAGAWENWGGLLLSVHVAVIGIVLSFPLGVLLAVGRRSKLPVVRTLSVLYIEFIRGVPLITLLFAGDLALRFFLPEGVDPPERVMRATVVVVLFTAAYIAEIVRGGLQAVPGGQLEAAHALSLGRFITLRKVVLPQSLRAVLPAIVGQFISLFKDTTLLTIIGLREMVGVAETVTGQQVFRNQGYLPELLAFIGLLFWVCCYSMSKASRRLERRLGVGIR